MAGLVPLPATRAGDRKMRGSLRVICSGNVSCPFFPAARCAKAGSSGPPPRVFSTAPSNYGTGEGRTWSTCL